MDLIVANEKNDHDTQLGLHSRFSGGAPGFCAPGFLAPEAKTKIFDTLFGTASSPGWGRYASDARFEAFWQYYFRTCWYVAYDGIVKTHQDVLDFADQIRAGNTRREIRNNLRAKCRPNLILAKGRPNLSTRDENQLLDKGINLAAKLITLSTCGATVFDKTEKCWTSWLDEESLQQVIAAKLANPEKKMGSEVKFERKFTALNLERIAGIKVEWTWNLLDHLRLADDDRTVYVFTALGYLRWQLYNGEPLLPVDFLAETSKTLALLFPKDDPEVMSWYKKKAVKHQLDPWVLEYGTLQPQNRGWDSFHYYRDRLTMLKNAYDEAKPLKPKQLYYDRRNGPRFFAVVIATIITFLMLISIILRGAQLAVAVARLKLQEQQLASGRNA